MKKKVNSILGAFGLFSSTMSIVLLTHQGIVELGWVGPFQTMVQFWEGFTRFVTTYVVPIGPILNWLLAAVTKLFGWAQVPVLQPHFKHVFILLMTVFATFTKKTFEEGNYGFGAYGLTVGVFFASLAALVAGLIPVESENFTSNFLVSLVPAACFWATVYLVWLPRDRIIGGDLKMFLIRCGVSTVVIAGAIYWISSLSTRILNVGIFCLLGFVVSIGFLRVLAGLKGSRAEGSQFRKHPFTQRGLWILAGFVGAAIFTALNAGWMLVV